MLSAPLRAIAGLVFLAVLGLAVVSCGVNRLLGLSPSGAGAGASSMSTSLGGPSPSIGSSRTPGPVPAPGTVVPIDPLQGPFAVVRVVDGDTVRVDMPWGEESIRLIGIDTPETVHPTKGVECYGPEASAFAGRLMNGETVWIEYDASQGRRDKYDRLLAYVWLTPTRMYNLVAVEGGYASEYTYSSVYVHQDAFRAAEASARTQQRGLWGACPSR